MVEIKTQIRLVCDECGVESEWTDEHPNGIFETIKELGWHRSKQKCGPNVEQETDLCPLCISK